MHRSNRTVGNLAQLALAACCLPLAAHAATYTEGFDAPFPAWQSGWFGTLSNATNYCATNYCYVDNDWHMGADVQGPTTGLWLGNLNNNPFSPDLVTFDAAFGASLSSLKIDVASYVDSSLLAWDADGTLIFQQALDIHDYHDVPATSYQSFTITSTQGISSFEISGMSMGNVVIDNLVAVTAAVPEPASAGLLLGGLALLGAAAHLRHRRS